MSPSDHDTSMRRVRRRKDSGIRLMPPTFVELPAEDEKEVVRLLAEILTDAVRRQRGLPPLDD